MGPVGVVARIIDFDDGHSPGNTEVAGKIALNAFRQNTNFLAFFDNLLPEPWVDRAYEYAGRKNKPWGVYISAKDASDPNICAESIWENGDRERAIALIATRELVHSRGKALIGSDEAFIHGTAVWCLSSTVGNEVNYHIDYAELYRYETNTIHPPLLAGTFQVSPFNVPTANNNNNRLKSAKTSEREQSEQVLERTGEKNRLGSAGDKRVYKMEGGDFMVNTGGLQHYQRFGYKGKLASKEEFDADLRGSADWVRVPYKCNRGILHDGDFPHLSTPVICIAREEDQQDNAALSPAQSLALSSQDQSHSHSLSHSEAQSAQQRDAQGAAEASTDPLVPRRVILGFNCFSQELSECCTRAPEHSDAFNRTVKLYQTMAALGVPITSVLATTPAPPPISSRASSREVPSSSPAAGGDGGEGDANAIGLPCASALNEGGSHRRTDTQKVTSACGAANHGAILAQQEISTPAVAVRSNLIKKQSTNSARGKVSVLIPWESSSGSSNSCSSSTSATIDEAEGKYNDKGDKDKLRAGRGKTGGVTVKDVLKNPAMAKLIVAAARRVKLEQAHQHEQQQQSKANQC